MTGGSTALLAAVAGVALLGGALADWSALVTTREVGGVVLTEVATVAGPDLAPAAAPLGLAGLLLSPLLAVRRLRRLAGGAAAAVGVAALGVCAVGLAQAAQPTAGGPAAALLGAAGLALAGGAAARAGSGSTAAGSSRYTVEAVRDGPDDDEWHLAAAEEASPE